MTQLLSSYTRILIPFTYSDPVTPERLAALTARLLPMRPKSKSLSDAQQNAAETDATPESPDKEAWLLGKSQGFQAKFLYPNIMEKIHDESPNQTLHSYILNNGMRSRCDIPPVNRPYILTFRRKSTEVSIEFFLKEICLHFFDSRTGFLDLEVQCQSEDFHDMAAMNHYLYNQISMPFSEEAHVAVRKQVGKDAFESTEYTIIQVRDRLLTLFLESLELKPSVSPFTFKHLKPFMYTSAVLDSPPSEGEAGGDETRVREKWLFVVANNHNWGTHTENTKPRICSTFAKSFWGLSSHGAINLSWANVQENFNRDTFPSYMKQHYLKMYLIAANQYITLMNFIDEVDDIIVPAQLEDEKALREVQIKIDELSERISKFKIRDTFLQVSYYDHINEVYDGFCASFSLARQMTELMDKVEQMKNLHKTYSDKLVTFYRYERSSANQTICFLAMLFGAVSLLNDSLDLMGYFTENLWLKTAISFTTILIFACLAYRGYGKIRETTRSLNQLSAALSDEE